MGYKQLQTDPWQDVEGKFPVGSRISGGVTNLTDYGAFIEIEPGIEGMVHLSELSWSKKVKHPSQAVNIGDKIEAIILDVDLENRRISLGMKQLQPNPWDVLEEKYPVGSRVKGVIRNIADFGLFIDIGVGIDGMIHISDVSEEENPPKLSERFKKGEEVEAVVLNIDREAERFALGLKQLNS